jgi:dTMP kinase
MATKGAAMRGRFITFEGGEGTGKSTQVRLLADRLRALGLRVAITREPGGSPGAEAIRHVLLSGAAEPLGPDAEAILFAAARLDHVSTVIEPSLAAGAWVLCDRFADSTRVYQGALGRVDGRLIRSLERLAVGETRPDATIVLDLPPYIGLARAARRRGGKTADRFEQESLSFHERLQSAFRALAQSEPERCALIDARGTVDDVAASIWSAIEQRLGDDLPRARSVRAAQAAS